MLSNAVICNWASTATANASSVQQPTVFGKNRLSQVTPIGLTQQQPKQVAQCSSHLDSAAAGSAR